MRGDTPARQPNGNRAVAGASAIETMVRSREHSPYCHWLVEMLVEMVLKSGVIQSDNAGEPKRSWSEEEPEENVGERVVEGVER